jgi:hypothetical protein
LVRAWRRLGYHLVSAGGWIAHHANEDRQSPPHDHDTGVRPRWIFFWLGADLLLVVALGFAGLDSVLSGRSRVSGLFLIPVLLPFIAFLILAGLGWRAGLVPFVADSGTGQSRALPIEIGGLTTRVTGVVRDAAWPLEDNQRIYRHRPAEMAFVEGEFLLLIDRWENRWHTIRKPIPAAIVRLSRTQLLAPPDAGTAILATGERPTVRLQTPEGRLLLAFDQLATRDGVLAALLAWSAGAEVETVPAAGQSRWALFQPGASPRDRLPTWLARKR